MKIQNSLSIFFLTVSVFFIACSQSQNDVRVSANPEMLTGKWKIELFKEGSVNETSSFSRILFQFESNGNFKVLENANVLTQGNWRLTNNNQELVIDVPDFRNEVQAAVQFGDDVYEIHDDWQILEFSAAKIRLKSGDEEFTLIRQ
jgi:hypothetical protein